MTVPARLFDRAASWVSDKLGSGVAFGAAFASIVFWALMGPIAGFSDTWQLVINTATTVVTFLVVFLLQHSQNKDFQALHLKLDTLVSAVPEALNEAIQIERLDRDALCEMRERIERELAARE